MAKFQLKDLVLALVNEGLSNREVAEKANTSEDYVRAVISRERRKNGKPSYADGLCRYCGQQLVYTPNAKKKKQFCDSICRSAFHNANRKFKAYSLVCEECGEQFICYGYAKMRFCSQDCRTRARKKVKDVERAL